MPRHTGRTSANPPHAQVGMLMRAYRESFPREDGRLGITQRELLQRMAAVDDRYALRSSHGTVSRWESGDTTPTIQRLEVFGTALNLTEAEVQGLILIAGLDPRRQETRTLECTRCKGQTETTLTKMVREPAIAGAAVSAVIRTRTCLRCGHRGQSVERWADSPEESQRRRYRQILRRAHRASGEIQSALSEAIQIR